MAKEGSTGLFSSFWKRSVDDSPSRELAFLPPNQMNRGINRDPLDTSISAATKKMLRRAQVKKAQIEHRQRKKNYVQHLEQDVKNWRKMVATIHNETVSIQTENDEIKRAISTNNLPILSLATAGHSESYQQPIRYADPRSLPNFSSEETHHYQDVDSFFRTTVTSSFDTTIAASCLQVNYSLIKKPDIISSTRDQPTSVANNFNGEYGITKPNPNLLKPLPWQSRFELDCKTAQIAINFILALEHPCRTHFHPIPTEFDPEGSPTGHELMASTSLYTYAPSYVFEYPSESVWNVKSSPISELQKLREMDKRLIKTNSEITPVQIWFLLMESYDLEVLLGNEDLVGGTNREKGVGYLEQLKRELSALVNCCGFGAVIESFIFWDVVERVLI